LRDGDPVRPDADAGKLLALVDGGILKRARSQNAVGAGRRQRKYWRGFVRQLRRNATTAEEGACTWLSKIQR
jgi:phosphogluconate dehydratase